MSPPTSPYCTTQQVAYLLSQMFPGQVIPTDFDNTDTIPSLTQVTFITENVSAEIEMAFLGAGYKIPFAVWESESWAASQTYLLRLIAVMGSAANIAENVPLMGQSGEAEDPRAYRKKYDSWLERIQDGDGLRFRADCYPSTPAWRRLRLASGPRTNWGESIVDAADFATWTDATLLLSQAYEDVRRWAGGNLDEYELDINRAFANR